MTSPSFGDTNHKATQDALLHEQIAYYRARAGEYDQWFLRQGRYDHGPGENARCWEEVAQLEQALEHFSPKGLVLEIASGTGLWTQRLLPYADSVTALDASPEVIALNRQRLGDLPRRRVRYVEADVFSWEPDGRYDTVFFGFWLSHVPPERFGEFWGLVRAALAPGGRVFFVDSLYSPGGTAVDQRLEGERATTLTRRLNDGREFRIVKVYYRPAELEARLERMGWSITVSDTPSFFLYGEGRLSSG
jgi:demethylmenaquinone methyltransferase/2-methoxy-6-polyprenyl-1,4-benzoquinol methylase